MRRRAAAGIILVALVAAPTVARGQEPRPAGAPDGGGSVSAPLALPAIGPLIGFHDNVALATGTGQPADAGSGLTPERAAEDMAQAGATVARASVLWSAAEPARGTFSSRYIDRVRRFVRALAERDIRFIAVVGDAPAWARVADGGDGWDTMRDEPALVEAYGAFAARVATELGSDLAAIEVWNEPNSSVFWSDRAPSPSLYARMLKAASRAIRATDSRAKVLFGGLLGITGDVAAGSNRYVWTQRFLLDTLRAGVGPGDVDGVALHAYPSQSAGNVGAVGQGSTVAAVIADARAALNALGPVPLWITETGVSTSDYGDFACRNQILVSCAPGSQRTGASPEEQARWVESLVRKLGSDPGIAAVVIHALYEPPTASNAFERGFGIVDVSPHESGTSFGYRPAWCGLRALTGPQPADGRSGCPAAQGVGAPRIRGALRHRRTLSATFGGWGPDAPPLRIRWLRCETPRAATCKPTSAGRRYKVRTPDIGRYVAVRVETTAGPRAVVRSAGVGPIRAAARPKRRGTRRR